MQAGRMSLRLKSEEVDISAIKEHSDQEFHCVLCDELFDSESLFVVHSKEHETERIDKCDSSDNEYVPPKTKQKKQSVVTKSQYDCASCGKQFRREYLLNKHKCVSMNAPEASVPLETINIEVEDKSIGIKTKKTQVYRCEICSKNFKLRESFKAHQRVHSGEKPFTCEICGKNFSHSGGLYYHLKHVHGGVKNHSCNLCGRSFALKAAMEDHRRIHTGERPYVCSSCGKSFKAKASLYIHNKIHTNIYAHPCTYCDRRFRWRQQLIAHVTTHTGEKRHSCEICGKGFGVKNDLTRHKHIHSDLKPFSCTVCGLSFGQKRYLKNHEKSRHVLTR